MVSHILSGLLQVTNGSPAAKIYKKQSISQIFFGKITKRAGLDTILEHTRSRESAFGKSFPPKCNGKRRPRWRMTEVTMLVLINSTKLLGSYLSNTHDCIRGLTYG
jgi:hypothetical protein